MWLSAKRHNRRDRPTTPHHATNHIKGNHAREYATAPKFLDTTDYAVLSEQVPASSPSTPSKGAEKTAQAPRIRQATNTPTQVVVTVPEWIPEGTQTSRQGGRPKKIGAPPIAFDKDGQEIVLHWNWITREPSEDEAFDILAAAAVGEKIEKAILEAVLKKIFDGWGN